MTYGSFPTGPESRSDARYPASREVTRRKSGYGVVVKPFDVVLAVIDEVAQAEKDQLLGAGHGELRSVWDRLWWQRETGQLMAIIKNLPDGEKVMEKCRRRSGLEGLFARSSRRGR